MFIYIRGRKLYILLYSSSEGGLAESDSNMLSLQGGFAESGMVGVIGKPDGQVAWLPPLVQRIMKSIS